MTKREDLTDKQFEHLTVIKQLESINGRRVWLCKCKCGNEITVKGVYLKTGETTSCGCIKLQQDKINLREQYDNKRIDGIVKPLFKGKEPRIDSGTGFRGVSKYYTRKSKELKYRAWITVSGKRYYKSGFDTAEDAYYKGRLQLEKRYLPN